MELVEHLVSSDQSDELKRSLAYKFIMKTVSQPMNSSECRKVFLKLTDWVIHSEHKFLRENALLGFDALTGNSFSVFHELVDESFFKKIFSSMKTHPVNVVGLIITIFSKLPENSSTQLHNTVASRLVHYLAHHGHNPIFLQSLEHLYTMYPSLLPVSTQDVTMLGNVVIHLHSSHPSNCQCIVRLDRLLSHVWITSPTTTPCCETLGSIFHVLSATATPCPPACLSAVLEALPPDILDQNLSALLDQPAERLLLTITRVFAWLEVREASLLTSSVMKLLTALGAARGSLVSTLSQTCLVRLVTQVTEVASVECRQQLVLLAINLLYGEQQSPAAIQSVAHLLPVVTQVLAVEEMWQTRDLILEAAQYFEILFPGALSGTQLQSVIQEENLPDLISERRHQLASWAWDYPGNIKLDRRPGQLVGLVNLGNTCYMNSILQALFCTQMFQSQVTASRRNPTQPVLSSMQRLFRCMNLSRRSSFSPRQFLDISRPPWFDAGHQQDCGEFLTFLLHCLEEEDKMVMDETMLPVDMQWQSCTDGGNVLDTQEDGGPSNSSQDSGVDSCGDTGPGPSSLVQTVFGGQLDTSYKCLECSYTSHVTTSFTDLPLAFPNTTRSPTPDLPNLPNISITRASSKLSVKDLLKNYLEPEYLCEDNQYQCDQCEGLRDAVKTTQIKAAPEHLIVTLLRFKFDSSTCRKVKLLRAVDCPETLSLPVSGGELVSYQLYCVVVHFGQSSEGGHYYSWVRDSEQWHKVSDEEAEAMPGSWDQEEQGRRDTPYMLFYQRESGD